MSKGLARSSQSYPPSLEALSADQNSAGKPKHTTYAWPGIFEYLIGSRPSKAVFDIGDSSQFESVYGAFAPLVYAKKRVNPGFSNQERFEECWNYTHLDEDDSDHLTLVSAFKQYDAFLRWLNRNQPQNDGDKGTVTGSSSSEIRYWTYSPGRDASAWDEVQKDGVIALSFKEVGDFSKLGDKAAITAAFQNAEGDDASHKNGVAAVLDFRDVMKPGDLVFAKKGRSPFLGVGRVTGEFYYDASKPEFPNRRKIDWIKIETHEIDDQAALKTLTDITSCPDFVEKLLKASGLDQTGNQMKSPEDESLKGDILTIALRCFEQARKDDPKYHAAEDTAREWFKDFSEEKLKANFGPFGVL